VQRFARNAGAAPSGHDFGAIAVHDPAERDTPGGRAVQRDGRAPQEGPASVPAAVPGVAPVAPLFYNDNTFEMTSPDPLWTEPTIEAHVKSVLTSVTVTGITPGMPPETKLYLLFALSELEGKEHWGQEIDVAAPIARAAKAGTPDPVGRITVRIDEKGNGEVELVAAGPIPQSPATTVATATPLLIADPGFVSVRDDSTAAWSDAEIADVVEAMTMVPKADKAALKGVELIRVKTIAGDFAGEFTVGGGVAVGGLVPAALPSLKLADKAFDPGGTKFYGGTKRTVPSSYEVILHEVGHAVSNEAYRAAWEARNQSTIALNKLSNEIGDSGKKFTDLTDDYKREYDKYVKETDSAKKAKLVTKLTAIDKARKAELAKNKAAEKKYNKADKVHDKKGIALKATTVDETIVVPPLTADATTKKADAATALGSAKGTVGVLKPALVADSKAYMNALDATATAIDTFTTSAAAAGADLPALEGVVLAQVEKRNAARDALTAAAPGHLALGPLNRAADAQDAWLSAARTAARAPTRPLRLQKFVDLVTAKKIAPFTEYAKENWPFKPGEFYAEAYALWLADPEFLDHNYGDLYDFFQNGDYRL